MAPTAAVANSAITEVSSSLMTPTEALTVVEQRVREEVKQLHAVIALLRALVRVEERYATEYSKLPLAMVSNSNNSSNGSSNNPVHKQDGTHGGGHDGDGGADDVETSALLGVTHWLERVLSRTAHVQHTLADELKRAVLTPLQAFARQHKRQTAQLRGELSQAVYCEKQHHSLLVAQAAKLDAKRSSRSVSSHQEEQEEDSLRLPIETTSLSCNVSKQVEGMVHALRETRDKRDQARNQANKGLDELVLTHEQHRAVMHEALQRCFLIYERYIRERMTECEAQPPMAPIGDNNALVDQGNNHDHDNQEEGEFNERSSGTKQECKGHAFVVDALQQSELSVEKHMEATTWMITVFTALAVVEESKIKRLQALLKGHSIDVVQAVFPGSTLVDFTQTHTRLVSILADPICRTLRISKGKQTTIQSETRESLRETQRRVQQTRHMVRNKAARWMQRRAAAACELQQQQQQQRQQQQQQEHSDQREAGGTGHALEGFRQAVANTWGNLLSSPSRHRFKLVKSKSASNWLKEEDNPKGDDATHSTPLAVASAAAPVISDHRRDGGQHRRRANDTDSVNAVPLEKSTKFIERELEDARSYLAMLEKKEHDQRIAASATLRVFSRTSMKTMHMMVKVYTRNVSQAMRIQRTAVQCCQQMITKGAPSVWERVVSEDPIPLQALITFPDDGATGIAAVLDTMTSSESDRTTHTTETDQSKQTDDDLDGTTNETGHRARAGSLSANRLLTRSSVDATIESEGWSIPRAPTIRGVVASLMRTIDAVNQAVSAWCSRLFQASLPPTQLDWAVFLAALAVALLGACYLTARTHCLAHEWANLRQLQQEHSLRLLQTAEYAHGLRETTPGFHLAGLPALLNTSAGW